MRLLRRHAREMVKKARDQSLSRWQLPTSSVRVVKQMYMYVESSIITSASLQQAVPYNSSPRSWRPHHHTPAQTSLSLHLPYGYRLSTCSPNSVLSRALVVRTERSRIRQTSLRWLVHSIGWPSAAFLNQFRQMAKMHGRVKSAATRPGRCMTWCSKVVC